MKIGEKVKAFNFTATDGLQKTLKEYENNWIVLYFYPKDATPGCTLEGQDFTQAFPKFSALNTEIFGISRDSINSHEKFKSKYEFPFQLISDVNEQICQLFDVIKTKNMYGKIVQGIERSTFLIGPDLILKEEWRKVKVKNHVAEVLERLEKLQNC